MCNLLVQTRKLYLISKTGKVAVIVCKQTGVDTGEEKLSRNSCGESNPGPFDHESGAVTTDLSIPAPN